LKQQENLGFIKSNKSESSYARKQVKLKKKLVLCLSQRKRVDIRRYIIKGMRYGVVLIHTITESKDPSFDV
jgi:hypothetical protein